MQVDIDLPRRESLLITKNIITPMLPLLSKFVLHPIRDLLIPMDNEAIWKNHLSPEYCGPDFAHGIHVPRWRGKSKLTSETRFGEGPHLLRCYDFFNNGHTILGRHQHLCSRYLCRLCRLFSFVVSHLDSVAQDGYVYR